MVAPSTRSDGEFNPDSSVGSVGVVGWIWSDADWEWWPIYMDDVRGATGNSTMSLADARSYVRNVWGFDIFPYKPATGVRPVEDDPLFEGYDPDTLITSESFRDVGTGATRGSGRAAQTYVAPDKRTVEENVKAYVVATTGMYNKALVAKGVQAFMSEDKKAFDQRDTVDLDPWAAVQSTVRGSQEYKSIHQLRPEAVDEMEWVTSRQSKLMQLGISAQRAAEMGVQQAKVGGTDEDLMMASDIASASYKEIGQSQRNALTNAATNVARMIR